MLLKRGVAEVLGMSWRDRVPDRRVMGRVQTGLRAELHFAEDVIKRRGKCAGHVLRGSSGLSHLQILEGKVEGRGRVGRPMGVWMNGVCNWSLLDACDKVKRAAEDGKR